MDHTISVIRIIIAIRIIKRFNTKYENLLIKENNKTRKVPNVPNPPLNKPLDKLRTINYIYTFLE